MTVSLVVAIISAAAALAAAVLSVYSALGARRSADAINSKNHQVAVIDRDAEELRATYGSFIRSLVDPSAKGAYLSAGALANGELLIASRAANASIEKHTNALKTALVQRDVSTLGNNISSLTADYVECQALLEEKRDYLLKPLSRRWWQITA